MLRILIPSWHVPLSFPLLQFDSDSKKFVLSILKCEVVLPPLENPSSSLKWLESIFISLNQYENENLSGGGSMWSCSWSIPYIGIGRPSESSVWSYRTFLERKWSSVKQQTSHLTSSFDWRKYIHHNEREWSPTLAFTNLSSIGTKKDITARKFVGNHLRNHLPGKPTWKSKGCSKASSISTISFAACQSVNYIISCPSAGWRLCWVSYWISSCFQPVFLAYRYDI